VRLPTQSPPPHREQFHAPFALARYARFALIATLSAPARTPAWCCSAGCKVLRMPPGPRSAQPHARDCSPAAAPPAQRSTTTRRST